MSTPEDARPAAGPELDRLAAIHAASFPDHPRPWSAQEIRDILATSGAFLIELPQGFLIGRVLLDEAELLTVAVAPEARRQGIGAALLQGFIAKAALACATTAFLEVASDNAPAQALYARGGWQPAGRRRNYYAPGIDAVVLTRKLLPDNPG
ncbi:GNAT family N-acetyltransferase [Paracoccus aminophilus]|uniref:Ribosomal-protein-alanine N-acetyltransferase n=1 Tax=Paracoccus aminophilus JCM 7686 TaxID=1367847 RepID=S5XQQ0_PARAH|nr:GNAT family N-acetyltransferase [Paracoccus aminophilus]AGT09719.1 ribosomal-protein-alanine N-acetyltransferase [Paracoccus aminophilus JCM 7686]